MNQVLDNQLFEAFANSSHNIFIYVTDMKTDLTRWSMGAVELFGIEEYMKNTGEKWVEYVHPDDRSMYLEDIMAVLSGKREKHNCQYRVRKRNGDYIWVECRGSLIKDDDGTPSVFAGIMTRIDNQNKYDNLTHLLTGYELSKHTFNGNGSLMLIGIDNFRNINSRYGIIYGNKILSYLAKVLLEEATDTIVYRFQGDEFAILATGEKPEYLVTIFKRVYRRCANPNSTENIIGIKLSAGIVEYENEGSCVYPLSNAELCLSHAKHDNQKQYAVYSDEIKNKQLRRDMVSEVLLKCIREDYKGFRLVYQPIFSNTGDRIIACEALCRWDPKDERIGNCYPNEFIPVLESNGGINDLGYFVMREAIRQAGQWQKLNKNFYMSFNVSYLQLQDAGFVPAVLAAIDEYDVNPEGIVMELTESVLDVDTVVLKEAFATLKGKGINIALDDFGTGSSSFWMLNNIDVDVVKLDQSFIRGLDQNFNGISHAIVESIGIMCSRIGCKTVAEGVENDDIWKIIKGFGFTGLQGYLFSKPVEVSDFEELLIKYNTKL